MPLLFHVYLSRTSITCFITYLFNYFWYSTFNASFIPCFLYHSPMTSHVLPYVPFIPHFYHMSLLFHVLPRTSGIPCFTPYLRYSTFYPVPLVFHVLPRTSGIPCFTPYLWYSTFYPVPPVFHVLPHTSGIPRFSSSCCSVP